MNATFVGRHRLEQHVFMVPVGPEVDAHAPHRVVTVRLTLLPLRLQQVDGREVPPQVEMGRDT
jgi:hypothetical protein